MCLYLFMNVFLCSLYVVDVKLQGQIGSAIFWVLGSQFGDL
jgi:hypothetical protein